MLAALPWVTSLRAEPADARHSPGPFLANGSRNSWADQASIVIWTRTTRAPDMVADGPSFVAVSHKEAATLAQERDAEKLLAVQLPPGARLDEMFGACPGAPGRVRLSYYPEGKPDQIRHQARSLGAHEGPDAVQVGADFFVACESRLLQPDHQLLHQG
ncbi:MAG: hypothetical protein RLZZ21_92 [Planctomycetota bacterium]|jgi:hypothetical protein